MRPLLGPVALALGAMLASGLAAGCGAAGEDAAAPPPSAGASASASAPVSAAPPGPTGGATSPPAPPPGSLRPTGTPRPTTTVTGTAKRITVRGTVVAGVEAGCLVLQSDRGSYVLLGTRDLTPRMEPGGRVEITGDLIDAATICQQGRALLVREVRPLTHQPGSDR